MKLVRIQETKSGYILDPQSYLDQLPDLLVQLPPGAAAFASDPQHYDFYSEYCVKDLKLLGVSLTGNDSMSCELNFGWSYEAEQVLSIKYLNVADFVIHSEGDSDDRKFRSLADLQLDEILPHSHGCSHEIQFISGRIQIVCKDMTAIWRR